MQIKDDIILNKLKEENVLFGLNEFNVESFLLRWDKQLSLLKSKRQWNCPYHSISHLVGVAMMVEKMLGDDPDLEATVVAAIHHDIDYHNPRDDVGNIVTAINVFELDYYGSNSFKSKVIELIKGTLYPYQTPPENRLEAILRDADILYSLVFCNEQTINRLFLAWGPKIGIYTLREFISRNKEFISTTEYFSEEGKKLAEHYLPFALIQHDNI
ncbi:HD superfamily hydrolase [Aeromonas phage AerS_266]|nr:HD superfamily hydrolase [Aeromonas phage AerS_266]